MKTRKRFLSLALALVMCLGLIPTLAAPASAAGPAIVEAIPCQYDWVNHFSEGLAAVGRKNGETHINANYQQENTLLYGFIDKTGREVVSCKYDRVGQFSEGLAAVGRNNWRDYGFINHDGVEVIPCQYYVPTLFNPPRFSEGFVTMYTSSDGSVFRTGPIIDTTGKELPLPPYLSLGEFHEGLAAVRIATEKVGPGRWGFVDQTGNFVIPAKYFGSGSDYDTPPRFSEGLAAVQTGAGRIENGQIVVSEHFCYIDKTGQEVISLDAREVRDFHDGLARVYPEWQGDRFYGFHGFIDKTGKLVIPLDENSGAKDFSEGMAAVSQRHQGWGFMDKTGKRVISCQYYDVKSFSGGMAAVRKYEKWGFIDKAGKTVASCQYEEVLDFNEGYAAVKKNGLWGYIDATGQEVVPCQYEAAYSFAEGYAPVKKNGKYGFLAVDDGTIPPVTPTAYASTQTVQLNHTPVNFFAYALKDEKGNFTNYVKLRDVAKALSGSQSQFDVSWDGAVNIETGKEYTPVGGELEQVFGGDKAYAVNSAPVNIDGVPADLDAITLTDVAGGAHTYLKLRDLGNALGFAVDWSAETGITITIPTVEEPLPAAPLKFMDITEENVQKVLGALREKYPEGSVWTELPYQSKVLPGPVRGEQALVYTISDEVFGDQPITRTHSDPDKIMVGDIIQYGENYVLLVKKEGYDLYGVEIDFDGAISWHWTTHASTFPKGSFTDFSRYPL